MNTQGEVHYIMVMEIQLQAEGTKNFQQTPVAEASREDLLLDSQGEYVLMRLVSSRTAREYVSVVIGLIVFSTLLQHL